MPNQILVVCVGNICRSPMAAALMRAAAEPGLTVESAGIGALIGEPADRLAEEILAERGLSVDEHVARQLDEDLMIQSDLILTMEDSHVKWIESRWPQARGRVFKWGHWGDFDVPDPYRRGKKAFCDAFDLIERGLEDWLSRLKRIG